MTCWRMVVRPDMAQTLNSKSPDRKQPGKKLNNNKTLSPQLSNNLDREWEREGEIIVSLYNKLHCSIFWVNNPLLNPKEVEINVLRFFLSWVYWMLCNCATCLKQSLYYLVVFMLFVLKRFLTNRGHFSTLFKFIFVKC